jgi:hypothetical protein
MDDRLVQVLHKVELLCEKYPEFATALKKKLHVETTVAAPSSTMVVDERVDKIVQYLGLDFKLDTATPSDTKYAEISYSFIKDAAVRDMLVSDFREMMRFRYGTRSHKADFMEFCKYAHFQLEGLVNYFMAAWSLDDDDKPNMEIAKQNIEENWPKKLDRPTFRKDVKTVDDIDYFQKVTAIQAFCGINSTVVSRINHESPFVDGKVQIVNYLSDVITFIRKTRNELSHRGKIKTKNIDALIEQFESQKKPQQDSIGNRTYQFDTPHDRDIKYYMWYKYTPWDDVIHAIHIIETTIASNLE